MWQPIETAPKGSDCILVSDGADIAIVYWGFEGWTSPEDNLLAHLNEPTHWMPLPALPP